MNILTESEFESLKYLEDRLKQAQGDYIRRITPSDFRLVEGIYERLTGDRGHNNPGCGRCVLVVFKEVGKQYFEFKFKNSKK